MKSKNLIVVFSSVVYLAGNSNTPKRVHPHPVSAGGAVFA